MDWQEAVRKAIERLCSSKKSDQFTRQDLIQEELERIVSDTGCEGGETPEQTLSRVLQELRDMGEIEFLQKGNYRKIR
jgi:hypothetical protein